MEHFYFRVLVNIILHLLYQFQFISSATETANLFKMTLFFLLQCKYHLNVLRMYFSIDQNEISFE